MPSQETLNAIDDAEDEMDDMEQQRDDRDESEFFGDRAMPKEDYSLYRLFDDIRKSDNSLKVANLQVSELGNPIVTVRDALFLAKLGEMTNHIGWAEFWKHQAEMTDASSMSKKGWFTELLVSSKRFTNKTTNPGFSPLLLQKSRWNLFGGNK